MTDLLDRPTGAEDEDPGGADAFAVLGLPYSTDLDNEDVRRAYLVRLRAVHPDNGGDAAAAAAVTAAYDALRSGVRRGELLAAADRGSRPIPQARARKRAAGQPLSGTQAGVVPDAARRAELRARVAASRAAQGLPPFVTDEAVLSKIADLLVMMRPGADARAKHYPCSVGRRRRGAMPPGGTRTLARRGRPQEPSSWRMTRRRRRARERELAEATSARWSAVVGSWPRRAWLRVRYGRPWLLAARIVLAVAVPLAAQLVVPGDPAVPALAVGGLTWLLLTGRLDLAGRAWH